LFLQGFRRAYNVNVYFWFYFIYLFIINTEIVTDTNVETNHTNMCPEIEK